MTNITTDTETSAAQTPAGETAAKPPKKAAKKKAAKAAKKGKAKGKKRTHDAGPGQNKKATVIAMMKRAKGATLAEIIEATGWQPHTVRGFVSILGTKGGEKIESAKNTGGERSYRIAK